MRYQTNKLSGVHLDLAVALAESYVITEVRPSGTIYLTRVKGPTTHHIFVGSRFTQNEYSPYKNANIALPIMERETIVYEFEQTEWLAYNQTQMSLACTGDSILEACMRLHVLNKFGSEIDLPI